MRYKENVVQRRIQRSNTNQMPILDEETGYVTGLRFLWDGK